MRWRPMSPLSAKSSASSGVSRSRALVDDFSPGECRRRLVTATLSADGYRTSAGRPTFRVAICRPDSLPGDKMSAACPRSRKIYMSIDAETKTKLIAEYALTEGDTGSPEVQIAVLSHRIAALTEHLKEHKHDHHAPRTSAARGSSSPTSQPPGKDRHHSIPVTDRTARHPPLSRHIRGRRAYAWLRAPVLGGGSRVGPVGLMILSASIEDRSATQ